MTAAVGGPTLRLAPSVIRQEPPVFSAPQLTTSFVARAALGRRLLHVLLEDRGSGTVVALTGADGFGKTTLAEFACNHRSVQERFRDGVLWVSLGGVGSRADLVDVLSELCSQLAHRRMAFHDSAEGGDGLSQQLGNRRLLMVLDGAVSRAQIDPFLQGGQRCARLITWTGGDLLTGIEVPVEAMTSPEALRLLCQGLSPHGATTGFEELAVRSGNWPLLLRLLNGAIRQRVDGGTRLQDAVFWVKDGLVGKSPVRVDPEVGFDREAVTAVVDVALAAVERTYGRAAIDRYGELAIFPVETDIPLAVLVRYWQVRAGWSETEVLLFCRALWNVSLIQRFNPNRTAIRLHPLLRDQLRRRDAQNLPDLNQALLDAYREPPGDADAWFALPPDERYLWTHLAYHLREAGRSETLVTTVRDPRFIVTKAFAYGPAATEADLLDALQTAPLDSALIALHTAINRSSHLLVGLRTATDLATTLQAELLVTAQPDDDVVVALAQTQQAPALDVLWARLGHGSQRVTVMGPRHQGGVSSVTFGRGGRVITSGSDGMIWCWPADERPTQKRIALAGHTARVNALAYDWASDWVASGSADATVRLWNAESGEEMCLLRGHHGAVNAIAFGGSCSRLISGGDDGTLRLWDTDFREQVFAVKAHEGPVTAVAHLGSTDSVVSAGTDGHLRFWSLSTGDQKSALDGPPHAVHAVATSGGYLAAADASGTVSLWDVKGGTPVQKLTGHGDGVTSVAFDRSGARIASGGADGTVRMWDVAAGQPLGVFACRGQAVTSVAFEPDGLRVAAADADGRTRIIRPNPPASLQVDPAMASVRPVAFDASGARVFWGGMDGVVRCLDNADGSVLRCLDGHNGAITAVAPARSGGRFASSGADGSIRIWDAQVGTQLFRFAPAGGARALVFGPDGHLFSGGEDGVVRLWDGVKGGELAEMAAHRGPIVAIAISSDGQQLATGGRDRTIRVWDATSLKPVHELHGHDDSVEAIAFHPSDALLISGGRDGMIQTWDCDAGDLVDVLDRRPAPVSSVAASDDGRHLAYASHDGSVRVWDMLQREVQAELRLDASAWACCWGANQQLLVGGYRGVYSARLRLATGRRTRRRHT